MHISKCGKYYQTIPVILHTCLSSKWTISFRSLLLSIFCIKSVLAPMIMATQAKPREHHSGLMALYHMGYDISGLVPENAKMIFEWSISIEMISPDLSIWNTQHMLLWWAQWFQDFQILSNIVLILIIVCYGFVNSKPVCNTMHKSRVWNFPVVRSEFVL